MTNLKTLFSYSKAFATPFVNTKRFRTAATVLKEHGARVLMIEVCKLIKYHHSVVRPMHSITERIAKYKQRNKYKMYVLFISHELSVSGAPKAVLQACRAVQQAGGYVAVISLRDGPVKQELEQLDIPVIISTTYIESSPELLEFASHFHVVCANTVFTHRAVLHLQDTVPVIWRVAEGRFIEEEYTKKCVEVETALKTARNIYAVSEYTASYLEKYNNNVKILYLGLPDAYAEYVKAMGNSSSITPNGKLAFCMVGTIEKRKAHDVLIDAVLQMPEGTRRKAVFHIVGKSIHDESAKYERSVIQKARRVKEIIFHGELIGQRKYSVLANSDVLICISRDDPNPQVVIEGMMFGKPCIISENVGQRRLMVNGVNGFIVGTADSTSLCMLLTKVIDNPEILEPIKKRSRQIYLDNFTEGRFNRELIKIFNAVIKTGVCQPLHNAREGDRGSSTANGHIQDAKATR